MRKKTKEHLEKARDCAVLAIETYNKPAVKFRTGGYVTLMVIAWTSVFHAYFFQKGVKPFYKLANGRFDRFPDGDYKYWELSKCIKEYYGSKNDSIKANLELFIELRNKIEHRSMPFLDSTLFAECQALLLNFNETLIKLFGERYGIYESLSFSLQLFPKKRKSTAKLTGEEKGVIDFIDSYKSSLSSDILKDDKFAFRAYLIKVANHNSKDALAIQFIDYSKLSDEQKRDVDRVFGLVKEKHVPVVNSDLLRPSDVVQEVQRRLGHPKVKRYSNPSKTSYKIQDRFTSNAHTGMWQQFKVRPPNGSKTPKRTNRQYCHYDHLSRGYGYTKEWVDKCEDFIKIDENLLSLYANPDVIEIVENT